MLDVRGHVSVMWMSGGQFWIVRMGIIIVPVWLLVVPVHFLAVARDQLGFEVEFFMHMEIEAPLEQGFAFGNTSRG